jgi:NAD(P)-dependent dehydrogenase (short-subunit alcohol dehydrogenase family)
MQVAEDRKALVTGGASGFGVEISRRLMALGSRVAILDVNQERLEQVADELPGVAAIQADVRSTDQVSAAVDEAVRILGALDTLVISAGVFHIKPLEEVTEEDWDSTLDINLKGAFLVSQAAAPHIARSGRGRIVTISSDCGRRGFARQTAYCASKFGLIGLTESLAAELAASHTTVNCICPVGCPTTPMGQRVLDWKVAHVGASPEEITAAAASTNLLGRNSTESDIADAVLFFVSEHASFLTGVSLDVDGGARLGVIPGTR